MISICIPTYNRLPQLKQCLNTIFEGFKKTQYELIIADGGSTDGTLQYLRKLQNIKLIEIGELTGAVKASNACFKIAKGEYIFNISDDFELNAKEIIKSCKLMDDNPEIGLVSPKMLESLYSNYPNVAKNHYLVLHKPLIIRASVLEEIGFFDTNFETYFVDVDTSFSVLNKGYTIISTVEPAVVHNRVFDGLKKHNKKIVEKKEELKYYKNKWSKLHARIDDYLNSSPFKKYKCRFFFHLGRKLYTSRFMKYLMRKKIRSAVRFYDWVLQQSIAFEAKEFNHLKDFYLAQRLPEKIIK